MEHGYRKLQLWIFVKQLGFPSLAIPCSQPPSSMMSYPVLELMMEQERMNENVGSYQFVAANSFLFERFVGNR